MKKVESKQWTSISKLMKMHRWYNGKAELKIDDVSSEEEIDLVTKLIYEVKNAKNEETAQCNDMNHLSGLEIQT